VYLSGIAEFFESTGLFTGSIRNPFLYLSKTDMLRNLEPKLIDPVLRSVSCSRPSRYQDKGVLHCGYCVPCIYRRAAMMACGLDHAHRYAFDFVRDLPTMTRHTQADVRAVVAFAQRVCEASDVSLELLVLSHGHFPPDVGGRIGPGAATDYRPWADMVRRWARDLLAEVGPRCSSEVKRMLQLSRSRARSQAV
jgi:hypothetical protein